MSTEKTIDLEQGDSQQQEPKQVGKVKLIPAVKRLVLPFLFFDLLTSEGRQQYVENALTGRLGTVLNFFPMLLSLVVAPAHEGVAIWLGFAVQTFVICLKAYRPTYDSSEPYVFWIDAASFCALLGMGIYHATVGEFDHRLIGTILTSSILAAMMISMLVCHPFTMQFSRKALSDETITSSKFFLQMNYFISAFWVVAMAIVVACSWIALLLLREGSPEQIILGTVFSIVIPIAAGFATPLVVRWYMVKYAPKDGPVGEAIAKFKAEKAAAASAAAGAQQ